MNIYVSEILIMLFCSALVTSNNEEHLLSNNSVLVGEVSFGKRENHVHVFTNCS